MAPRTIEGNFPGPRCVCVRCGRGWHEGDAPSGRLYKAWEQARDLEGNARIDGAHFPCLAGAEVRGREGDASPGRLYRGL